MTWVRIKGTVGGARAYFVNNSSKKMKESGVHDSLTAEDREIASLMQGGTTMPVIMSYHPPQTKLATTTNSIS